MIKPLHNYKEQKSNIEQIRNSFIYTEDYGGDIYFKIFFKIIFYCNMFFIWKNYILSFTSTWLVFWVLVLFPDLTVNPWSMAPYITEYFFFWNGNDYVIAQLMLNKILFIYYYFGFSLEFITKV